MTPPNHLRRRLLSILALAALLFLTACPLPAPAQIPSGYVQTVMTVPSLANGTFGASWTNLSSSPQLGLLGCVSTFQTTVSGAVNAYGSISVQLADTAQICPSPSTWTFNFTFSCPVGQTPSSFMVQIPITGGGGTEDISAQVSAALPPTSCSGGGGGGGNLSGSGTTGYIPIWTGMHALGNSLEDYGVANPALFTFHAPIVVLSIPTFSAHVGPLGTMSASWNFDTTTPATALASLGATQSANTVWAGPTSGSPATPGFRALVLADFPSLTLYYQTMQANGSDQTQRPKLNFSTAFALTDSASPAQTTVGLANTTVTPGSYTNTNLTVGADGRITAATNGSGGFTSGQNGNGYWVQDPLGHIHQWGHLSGEVFNCNLITFPTSFTTLGSISAQATDDFAVGSSIQHSIVINASHGCTGISVTAMYDWVSSTGGNGVYWSADGY